MNIRTLQNSLFWQKHVFSNTKDSKQRERAERAIKQLEAQIKEAKNGGQN